MDPIMITAAASAAMAFLREVIPMIGDAVRSGEISQEEQERVQAEFASLKERADGQFQSEAWKSRSNR